MSRRAAADARAKRFGEAESRLWAWAGASASQQMLDLRRCDVRVRVQETGEGPPVLFVPGASTPGSSWAPLAARLQDYRCILLDRPGCGLSERPSASIDTLFEALDRLRAGPRRQRRHQPIPAGLCYSPHANAVVGSGGTR